MNTPGGNRRVVACLAFLMAASSGATHAGFFGLQADSFSFCSSSAYCLGERKCIDQELEFDGPCWTHCGAGAYSPPSCQDVLATVDSPWGSGGESGWWEGDAGLTEVSVYVEAVATPGVLDLTITTTRDYSTESHAEVAVIRFAGDPGVFVDLEVVSTAELLDLGIVNPGDLLFVKNDFPMGYYTAEVQVDTTGVPPEEIVIFYGGEGVGNPACDTPDDCEADDTDVPATSRAGLLVLVVALVTVTTVLVLRRRTTA
jgi:hypothetical protein